MSEQLALLLQQSQTLLLSGFVVFLRVGSAMVFLPGFGERVIPLRVRLALGLTFTAVVLPAVMPLLAPHLDNRAIGWLGGELLIGLAIGLALRCFVFALQIAGSMVAQSISLSQLFGGTAGEAQPAVGQLLMMGGLALAMKLGLHLRLTEFLIGSYTALPPAHWPDTDLLRSWEIAGITRAFSLAFSISAPFLIGALIYNIALGAINRAMPQLMVAFVGAPALTFGGLTLLAIAVPTGLMVWHDAFLSFLGNPFTAPR